MNKKGKVAVTGATGMVGTYLVSHLLEEGYDDIVVTVRRQKSLDKLLKTLNDTQRKCIRPFFVSIFDIAAMTELFKDAELLFHCAATVDLEGKKPQEQIEANVRITHCVAEAALLADVGRMVHISSIATLTSAPYPEKTTEDSTMTTLSGRSSYSISKFYSEGEVWRTAQRGLRVTVINPAVIIGAGDWKHGTSQFFTIVDKCPYFYTNGVMGYVSAKDVARMSLALAQKEETIGERYILCSDNLSFKELIGDIRTSLGKKGTYLRVPSVLIKAFIVLTGKKVLRNLIDKDLYDGTKAEKAAGIKYSSLKEEINKIGKQYSKK